MWDFCRDALAGGPGHFLLRQIFSLSVQGKSHRASARAPRQIPTQPTRARIPITNARRQKPGFFSTSEERRDQFFLV